jgi:hypothetical protein
MLAMESIDEDSSILDASLLGNPAASASAVLNLVAPGSPSEEVEEEKHNQSVDTIQMNTTH